MAIHTNAVWTIGALSLATITLDPAVFGAAVAVQTSRCAIAGMDGMTMGGGS